jgi:hypothetical protein
MDEQDRRRIPCDDCVEQMQLEAEEFVWRQRRCDDYVEDGHASMLSHRSSPNRKIDSAIIVNMKLGIHAATTAGSNPERPSDDVIPSDSQ